MSYYRGSYRYVLSVLGQGAQYSIALQNRAIMFIYLGVASAAVLWEAAAKVYFCRLQVYC
jgi:hypothetical protein